MEPPDLDDLKSRYSVLTTDELLRLTKGGEIHRAARCVVEMELAHRNGRGDVEICELAADEMAHLFYGLDLRDPEVQELLVKFLVKEERFDPATAAMILRVADKRQSRAFIRALILGAIGIATVLVLAGVVVGLLPSALMNLFRHWRQ